MAKVKVSFTCRMEKAATIIQALNGEIEDLSITSSGVAKTVMDDRPPIKRHRSTEKTTVEAAYESIGALTQMEDVRRAMIAAGFSGSSTSSAVSRLVDEGKVVRVGRDRLTRVTHS